MRCRPLWVTQMKAQATALLALLLFSILLPAAASASTSSVVQSTVLTVFADGTVEVNQTILPMNMSSVTLPLLSSSVGNILAVSDAGTGVSYQLAGGNITLSTFGVDRTTLVYDTDSLTSKTGSTWDLNFSSAYNLTLILPPQATVLYVSSAPNSFSTSGGSPVLSLSSGAWEVSYGLPFTSPAGTSSTTASSTMGSLSTAPISSTATTPASTTQGGAGFSTQGASNAELLGLAAAIVIVAALGAYVLLRRSRSRVEALGLRPEDREVLSFIREKGGSVNEVEVRERFSLPRTSAWRQAKRLEKMGLVRITKVGKQNQIELLPGGPEGQGS